MNCPHCGEEYGIGDWPFCRSRVNPGGHGHVKRHDSQFSDADAIVLYEHPTKGVRWPGRGDQPMPKVYAREGFQRVVYKGGIQDVRRIERQHRVVSEVGNYNRGGTADKE